VHRLAIIGEIPAGGTEEHLVHAAATIRAHRSMPLC
jgi:hypothetical protein